MMVTIMTRGFLRFSVHPYKTLLETSRSIGLIFNDGVFLPFCLAATVVLTFAGKADGRPIQRRIVKPRGRFIAPGCSAQ